MMLWGVEKGIQGFRQKYDKAWISLHFVPLGHSAIWDLDLGIKRYIDVRGVSMETINVIWNCLHIEQPMIQQACSNCPSHTQKATKLQHQKIMPERARERDRYRQTNKQTDRQTSTDGERERGIDKGLRMSLTNS